METLPLPNFGFNLTGKVKLLALLAKRILVGMAGQTSSALLRS